MTIPVLCANPINIPLLYEQRWLSKCHYLMTKLPAATPTPSSNILACHYVMTLPATHQRPDSMHWSHEGKDCHYVMTKLPATTPTLTSNILACHYVMTFPAAHQRLGAMYWSHASKDYHYVMTSWPPPGRHGSDKTQKEPQKPLRPLRGFLISVIFENTPTSPAPTNPVPAGEVLLEHRK